MLSLLLLLLPAQAATFTVNTAADIAGVCGPGCSLRQAIGSANATPGPDTIRLPPGNYNLTLLGAGENANATGDLDVFSTIDIIPTAAAGARTIRGMDADRVFHVANAFQALSLTGVTVTDGRTAAPGGAIHAAGNLTLISSTVSSSLETGVRDYNLPAGGGIFVGGNLTLQSSSIEGNTARHGRGGGAYVAGTALCQNSSLEENLVAIGGQGGGLFAGGALTANGCTVRYNSAARYAGGAIPVAVGGGQGGGIYAASTAAYGQATVTWNHSSEGGGVYMVGDATMIGTTVDDNTASIDGGGIYSLFGGLSTDLTSISRNTSGSTGAWLLTGGGGVFAWAANVDLVDTTLDGNAAPGGYGGALLNYQASFTVYGSTLSANDAEGGAAIASIGTLEMVNSTVSGNWSDGSDGAVWLWPGGGLPVTANLYNVTLALNYANAGATLASLDPNGAVLEVRNTLILDGCVSPVTTLDYNMETTNTCGLTGANDLPSTPTAFGPLWMNGGFTQTHAITAASPAANAASWGTCTFGPPGGVDQRGVGRGPIACDIGAFEH